jgi:uncharacterized protein (DUF58 family)
MVEAVQTTASPAAIWVMCVVMSILAGFMVSGVLIADAQQARASRRARMARELGSAFDGEQLGPGLVDAQAEARGRHARDEPVPQGDVPTRADLPAQPTPQQPTPQQSTQRQPTPGRHAMPAQRTGDADRAARHNAGPGTPDDDEGR